MFLLFGGAPNGGGALGALARPATGLAVMAGLLVAVGDALARIDRRHDRRASVDAERDPRRARSGH